MVLPSDFVERLCEDHARLSLQDVPELELVLLGSLVEFIASPAFRDDADAEHASVGLLAACWDAVSTTKGVSGLCNDTGYASAPVVREAVLVGAHDLAARGEAGLVELMETMVPIGQRLIEQGWPADKLAYQFAVCFLAALVGRGSPTDEQIEAIAELLPGPDQLALPEEVVWGYEDWQGYWAFLPRDDAEYWAGVRHAIASERWGELRRAVAVDDRDDVDDWGLDEEISDNSAIDPDLLPGYADGDWPPMPGALMLGWLPDDLVEAYGRVTTTVLNGDRLDIEDADQARELAAVLADRGVKLTRDDAFIAKVVGTIDA